VRPKVATQQHTQLLCAAGSSAGLQQLLQGGCCLTIGRRRAQLLNLLGHGLHMRVWVAWVLV
jgi:hypothetical protein